MTAVRVYWRPGAAVEERFWAKVDKSGVCWVWIAAKNHGYGRFGIGPRSAHRTVWAHRFAYELLIGPIPDGLQIDHLCRNRSCVNPAHLEAVTLAENIARMGAAITHCVHGHLYTSETTLRASSGRRTCRICHNLRRRGYHGDPNAVGVRHGTRGCYVYRRCRCEPCRTAALGYERAYEASKR